MDVEIDLPYILVNGRRFKGDVRRIEDLRPVLMEPVSEEGDAYYMFRDVKPVHETLRYDITVIPARNLGKEFIKTMGHYHDGSYPELYGVLRGEALFILQRRAGRDDVLDDLVLIRAGEGDIIRIPPYYGHVTVNISRKTLVLENIVCRKCKSNYEPYIRMRGAAVYVTVDGILRNNRYNYIPEIREEKPERGNVLGLSKLDLLKLCPT
ncbi:MAG: glucose-6-phosphate isomerase family protein [Candidatus Methanodesulfokora sp.]